MHVWAKIFGQSLPQTPLTYIDGFAGPGEYTNPTEGSPIAALDAIVEARSQARWSAGEVRLLFIEESRDRFNHLKSLCASKSLPPGVSVKCECTQFVTGIEAAKRMYGRAFASRQPLLVFVDPFGATGAPFSTIKEILSSEKSEVIVNFDADGVERIRSGKESADAARILTEVFGSKVWEDLDWGALDYRSRCFEAARLYKRCLLALPGVEYAFMFEMGDASGQLNYFLIFASRHETGLEKMKDVMKAIDQTGDYKFYDALVGQRQLFRFDQPELWIDPMVREFAGRTVPFREVKKWVLNETPFCTFNRKMLRPASERGLLAAVPRPGIRLAKGQFTEDKLAGVKFVGGSDA